MYVIKVTTLGKVAFADGINKSLGYKYDVPFDELDIPYMMLSKIIKTEYTAIDMSRVGVGFAHPDGYIGLLKSADILKKNVSKCSDYIRKYFTEERFVAEKGYNVRYLKSGLVFIANILFDPDELPTMKEQLEGITKIGVTDDGIDGRVSVELCSTSQTYSDAPDLLPNCSYSSLDYSVMFLSPGCFHAPYADGVKTYSYIPGEYVREELRLTMMEETDVNIDWLRFSNAYIGNETQRLFPVPLCVSVVKSDREQLRYRLSSGKDPSITEQDVSLQGSFTDTVQGHIVNYTTPETERIVSDSNECYDALSAGQIFRGTIYGSDNDIRKIARWLSSHPAANIGTLSEEGFGEIVCSVDSVNEDVIETKILAEHFDLCCLSDTLIINDEGMPSCKAEDLLKEIEFVLGYNTKLQIIGKYTGVSNDHSINLRLKADRSVTRCISAGSVLRIRSVDGPIDISKILHTFIGERTEIGYGEITVYPSRESYYRIAKHMPPVKNIPIGAVPLKSLKIGADMLNKVPTAMLKHKIIGFGIADSREYAKGFGIDELIPMDMLQFFRDRFDPMLPDEILIQWYTEGLEKNDTNFG